MKKLLKLNNDKRNIKKLVKEYLNKKNKYSFIKEYQTLFTNALVTSNTINNYGYSYQFNATNVLKVVSNGNSGALIVTNNPLLAPYTITLKCVSINANNEDMYVMTGLHSGNLNDLKLINGALQPVNTQARGFLIRVNGDNINTATANWLGFNYDQETSIGPLESYRIVYQRTDISSRFMQYTIDPNVFSIININGARVWSVCNSNPNIEYLFILIKPFRANIGDVNQEAIFELTINLIS